MDPTIPSLTLIADNHKAMSSRSLKDAELDAKKLDSACTQLESLFIQQLFQQMRATVPKSGLLGGESTEELYTSMLDQELSKELADRGGIGLASLLREQLSLRGQAGDPGATR